MCQTLHQSQSTTATGEYLGEALFTRNRAERLSVENSGFSVLRIISGVVAVFLLLVLIVVGRLIFLRISW
jgi:hypothetical protein